jgi:hypothetical protein
MNEFTPEEEALHRYRMQAALSFYENCIKAMNTFPKKFQSAFTKRKLKEYRKKLKLVKSLMRKERILFYYKANDEHH